MRVSLHFIARLNLPLICPSPFYRSFHIRPHGYPLTIVRARLGEPATARRKVYAPRRYQEELSDLAGKIFFVITVANIDTNNNNIYATYMRRIIVKEVID